MYASTERTSVEPSFKMVRDRRQVGLEVASDDSCHETSALRVGHETLDVGTTTTVTAIVDGVAPPRRPHLASCSFGNDFFHFLRHSTIPAAAAVWYTYTLL